MADLAVAREDLFMFVTPTGLQVERERRHGEEDQEAEAAFREVDDAIEQAATRHRLSETDVRTGYAQRALIEGVAAIVPAAMGAGLGEGLSSVTSKLLGDFLSATIRAGVDASAILSAVSKALDNSSTAQAGHLSESDSRFIEQFGGIDDPESGSGSERLSELVAEQAARDDTAFVSTRNVADLLGVDESRVRHRKSAGLLLSTKMGKELRYPRWQFVMSATGTTSVVPHLAEIAEVAADMHPAELASRMMTVQNSLRIDGEMVTPVDWLVSGGDVESVLDVLIDDLSW
ncbi:hypothetical protein [Herbiconiux sp. UC225_62]|uniref:hypothetical protein n=1 Tax=Herbiconiux sp. UC225_62 TaxID=3350168 RepID=UPI0036D4041C